MDIVLGVSMGAPSVRLVLVEGQDADGVTVDEDGFDVTDAAGGAALPDRVVSAILGTRESAAEGGYRLTSIGVTVADQAQATRLRDALASRRVDNVMLVSAFLAAAALAQTVGGSIGYRRTGLMFIEPTSATLAVVDSSDGAITDVQRVDLPGDDTAAVAQLTALAAQAHGDGLFVVGSDVNVGVVKAELDAASPIPVSVPEEPATALARGAALASAHAPLFDSSTSALAWARDPGTGMIDPSLVALGYAYASGGQTDYEATMGEQALAYSAVDDDDDDYLVFADDPANGDVDYPLTGAQPAEPETTAVPQGRKPFLLAGSGLAAFFVFGVSALVVALAVGIRPTADQRPAPSQHIVVPTRQAPAPAPKVQVPAPAPAPKVQVPAPAAPPVKAPAPAAPAPAPAAPAPAPAAPAPAPAAPAPAPAPAAPIPIPIPLPVQVPAPAPIEAPSQIRPPAQAPAPPPAKQPEAPKWPQIFAPPSQQPPKVGGGHDNGPSWLPGNGGGSGGGGGHDSAPPPPNPWAPGNSGGGHGGGSPWFPGLGGGGHGGGSLFPGFGGGGHDGGGGGGHGGGGGGHGGGGWGGGGWGGGGGHGGGGWGGRGFHF